MFRVQWIIESTKDLSATNLFDPLVEVNEINAYSVPPLCSKRAEINSISLTERCFVAAIYVYYMYLQIPENLTREK